MCERAESRDLTVGDAVFAASIEAGEDGAFSGFAETFDPFVTSAQVRLNIHGDSLACKDTSHQAIFFALSPQEMGHAAWRQLAAIHAGFVC